MATSELTYDDVDPDTTCGWLVACRGALVGGDSGAVCDVSGADVVGGAVTEGAVLGEEPVGAVVGDEPGGGVVAGGLPEAGVVAWPGVVRAT